MTVCDTSAKLGVACRLPRGCFFTPTSLRLTLVLETMALRYLLASIPLYFDDILNHCSALARLDLLVDSDEAASRAMSRLIALSIASI